MVCCYVIQPIVPLSVLTRPPSGQTSSDSKRCDCTSKVKLSGFDQFKFIVHTLQIKENNSYGSLARRAAVCASLWVTIHTLHCFCRRWLQQTDCGTQRSTSAQSNANVFLPPAVLQLPEPAVHCVMFSRFFCCLMQRVQYYRSQAHTFTFYCRTTVKTIICNLSSVKLFSASHLVFKKFD